MLKNGGNLDFSTIWSIILAKKAPVKGSLDFTNGIASDIYDIEIKDFVPDAYLPYAASTILDRALPGDDGLIPIQRRVLWAMMVNKHYPTAPYTKVASLQGEVMVYHPHGDQSIVNSIVRMGQPFSLRTTFVDPKGSFAKVPGDKAAAPRYISGRLTKAAMDSLEELKYDGVPMGLNYDNEVPEPPLIPVRFPASIINGAVGIATGFAVNMAQHNPTEAMEAARYVLKRPKTTVDELLKIMPAPDFQTGGLIIGTKGIRDYYETGSGSLTVRAKHSISTLKNGGATITFTELPPTVCLTGGTGVQDRINEILESAMWKDSKGKTPKDKEHQRKFKQLEAARTALQGVSRAYDQTDFDTDGVRFEVDVKPGYNAEKIAEALYQYTDLESVFSVNNTVIYKGHPTKVSMLTLFNQFLDFRKECVLRTSRYKIGVNNRRIAQIIGLLKVILDIDLAISLIRHSQDESTAKIKLIKQFKITDEQAEYILSMPLRRLTRQNKTDLTDEQKRLETENKKLNAIVTSEKALETEVDRLLAQTEEIIASPRRMQVVSENTVKHNVSENVEAAPCMIYVRSDGKIIRGEVDGKKEPKNTVSSFNAMTDQRIHVVTSTGDVLAVPIAYIPDNGKANSVVQLASKQRILGVFGEKTPILSMSSDGMIKITDDFTENKPLQKLKTGCLAGATTVDLAKNPQIIAVTKQGKAARFVADLTTSSMNTLGVIGMRLNDGDEIADITVSYKPETDVLLTVSHATVKNTPVSEIPLTNKGSKGVILHVIREKDEITRAAVNGTLVVNGKNEVVKPTKRAVRLNQPCVMADKATVLG